MLGRDNAGIGGTGRGIDSGGRLMLTGKPGEGIAGRAGRLSAGMGGIGSGMLSAGSDSETGKPGDGMAGSAGSDNAGIGGTGNGMARAGSAGKSHTWPNRQTFFGGGVDRIGNVAILSLVGRTERRMRR
jgi:hypothetical protein